MYQKGRLHLVTPPCAEADSDGYCDYEGDPGHVHSVYDSSLPSTHPARERTSGVYLDHSCGDWVIGGETEIQALIDDLLKALDRIRQR